VDLAHVESNLDGLAGRDALECGIAQALGGDALANALEGNILTCASCKSTEAKIRGGAKGKDVPLAPAMRVFWMAELSRIVPVLKIFKLFLPLLVMVALTAVLPSISSLTSRGVGAWGAAAAKETRAARPARNFIVGNGKVDCDEL
jgi:hypothetical protein